MRDRERQREREYVGPLESLQLLEQEQMIESEAGLGATKSLREQRGSGREDLCEDKDDDLRR
jgi:hypothetical protein